LEKKKINILRNAQKIKRQIEIEKLFKIGKKWKSAWCSVYSLENGMNRNRCAIVISKESGSAVERNKKKRHVREYLRKVLKNIPLHKDILIRIHPAKEEKSIKIGLEKALSLWFNTEKK